MTHAPMVEMTDIDRARASLLSEIPVREERLELAGIATAVLTGGPASAGDPPFVLLHGPGEFAAKWLRVIPDLVREHRVVAPDLPAHGASEGADQPLDIPRVLAWLGELIERTCAARPVLIGHVLGGSIAARFAARHGERLAGLVLVDSLGLSPFRPSLRFLFSMLAFRARPSESSYHRFMRQCSYDLDRLQEELAERWAPFVSYTLAVARSPSAKAVGRLLREVGLPPIPPEELARISVPTTLVWGRHDRALKLDVAKAASARYGWPLLVIENCADDPPRDRPQEFLKVLRTALVRG